MKQLKKIASLLLALVMVFGLAATALATSGDEGGGTDPTATPEPSVPEVTPAPSPLPAKPNAMEGNVPGGTITVTTPATGQTYSIYQIMYQAASSTKEGTDPVYVANSLWTPWLKTQTKYVVVTGEGENPTVTWVSEITDTKKTEFGKLALAYARGNNYTSLPINVPASGAGVAGEGDDPKTVSQTTDGSGNIVFGNLDRGYYLVDPTTEAISPNNADGGETVSVESADDIMQGGGEGLTGGSITINNAVPTQTYKVFQIMYLEKYSALTQEEPDHKNVAYKANSYWNDFLNSADVAEYVSVDKNGFVTWLGEQSEPRAAAFAKKALEYAAANPDKIFAVSTQTAPPSSNPHSDRMTLLFNNLNHGYYLVNSTVGTICALNTNNPDVGVNEKNTVPSNNKEVQEDSSGDWGKVNDADIGDTVEFRSTVTLPTGASGVIYHDNMTNLTLDQSSVKVYTDESMTQELLDVHYNVYVKNNTPTEQDTYVNTHCTFEVVFEQTYLNLPIGSGENTRTEIVYIGYSATINQDATIGTPGNLNSSQLSYGDENNPVYTPESKTKTYVWEIQVLKYANGNQANTLNGAKFVLLRHKPAENPAPAADDGEPSTQWQIAIIQANGTTGLVTNWSDVTLDNNGKPNPQVDNTTLTTDATGVVKFTGLDRGTYYLCETEAPEGYNVLTENLEVIITAETVGTGEDTTMNLTLNPIPVENRSGSTMPSTGGIGTTIFYIVGSALLVGAVVLLVTKKRMSVTK